MTALLCPRNPPIQISVHLGDGDEVAIGSRTR